MDVGMDYVYHMFRRWRDFCDSAAMLGVRIKAGSYQAFRTYFHLLSQLGLVRRVGTAPSVRGRARVLYELVPERVDDPAWARPFQEKYVSADWTVKTPEEKRALRRRYPRR